MKRFIEFIRMLVISPEMLAPLLIIGFFTYFPSFFSWVGANLSRSSDPIRLLSLTPIVILGFIIRGRKDLLFPDHPAGEVLQCGDHAVLVFLCEIVVERQPEQPVADGLGNRAIAGFAAERSSHFR